MGILYFLAFAFAIALDYFISKWFYEIAEEKGFDDRKYFWICFLLGVVGYLLVAAMPDRGNNPQNTFGNLPKL